MLTAHVKLRQESQALQKRDETATSVLLGVNAESEDWRIWLLTTPNNTSVREKVGQFLMFACGSPQRLVEGRRLARTGWRDGVNDARDAVGKNYRFRSDKHTEKPYLPHYKVGVQISE